MNLSSVPVFIVSSEFLLGGLVRLSRFPFQEAHQDINTKAIQAAPILYPVVPFRDAIWHNRYVGAWFLATGMLLAHPATRSKDYTIGLAVSWTSTLIYSHVKLGWPVWLPVITLGLEGLVWGIESGRVQI